MSNPMFGPAPGLSPAMPAQSHNPMPQNPTAQLEDRVLVGPCVINYPNLFVPRPKDDKKPDELYYSAEFIFFTETPDQMAIAQAAYQKLMLVANTVAQHKFKRNADQFTYPPVKTALRRSNGDPLKGMENRTGMYFSASSRHDADKPHYRPKVLVGNPPLVVVNPEDIYSGAVVYVSVTAGHYDQGNNRGIKFFLNSVLKAGDGPRLFVERSGADEFSSILHELPSIQQVNNLTPVPQPVYAPQMTPPGYGMPPGQPAYPPQAYGQPAAPAAPAYAPPQQYGMPPQGYAQPAFQSPPMPGFPQQ